MQNAAPPLFPSYIARGGADTKRVPFLDEIPYESSFQWRSCLHLHRIVSQNQSPEYTLCLKYSLNDYAASALTPARRKLEKQALQTIITGSDMIRQPRAPSKPYLCQQLPLNTLYPVTAVAAQGH
eukprot:TRINITY_DN2228_c0_g1_i1.p1 TRINITY_DN2228_c0_g1~~TRINITY_DN2228_c0_g1_i1.p1  ORF type:complete len:125 (+),score=2.91 TRINITY_DN2228_c0_g1_i1:80-454(+)